MGSCDITFRSFRSRLSARRPRRAFTLAEVLVALSLTLILVGAIYSALDLFGTYSTAGRDDAQRQQLVRVVVSRIDRDLRSAVYRDPPPVTEEDATTSGAGTTATASSAEAALGTGASAAAGLSGTTSTSTNVVTVSDPLEQSTGTTPGLFGTSNTLLVHCSRPSAEVTYLPFSEAAGSRTGDMLSVGYFVMGEGGGSLGSGASGTGLARLAGDRLSMMFADEGGDTSSLGSAIEVLAPEVNSLQFRYFDGITWTTEWDSVTMSGLPLCVEVQFAVTMSANNAPGGGGAGGKLRRPVTTNHRFVVAIPSATLPESSTSTEEETEGSGS
jgi:prepilin-type N-terminal cleavage/methylation domain-containing protein